MGALSAVFDIPQKLDLSGAREIKIKVSNVKIYRGGAVGVVIGTGYAVVYAPATSGMRFLGIALETVDNSAGSAGDKWIRVATAGTYQFTQTGLDQTAVGKDAYLSDDNTVTLTANQRPIGKVVTVDSDGNAWVCIDAASVLLQAFGADGIKTDVIAESTSGSGISVSHDLTMAAGKDIKAAAGAGEVDLSAMTSTFKTPTGAHTINGDVTLAAGKGVTGAAGAGAVDLSAMTGTFKTPTGAHTINGDVTVADGKNVALDTTTGTKIGTAVGQKLGFWNATPIVQPAHANQAAISAATATTPGAGADGTTPSGAQYAALVADVADIRTKVNEYRTALVNAGIMKGSA